MILRMIDIQRAGGTTFPAFIAVRQTATRATPCIVVAMHLWGVDDAMRAAAQHFADAGFVAIVPDLYARFNAPSGDGETDYLRLLPFAKQLAFEIADEDIRSAAAWLRERYPDAQMAIAGFCMGGVIAWRRTGGIANCSAPPPFGTERSPTRTPLAAMYRLSPVSAKRTPGFPPAGADVRRRDPDPDGYGDLSRRKSRFLRYLASRLYRRPAEAAWERTLAFLRVELGSPV
jgi:hypothetical protein